MIRATDRQLCCASIYLITDGHGDPAARMQAGFAAKRPQTIRRVAVVEDELMVAWSIETMLEDLGLEVVGVYSSGEEAASALAGEEVDLLCMDINLGSGIDGIEAARRIRKTQAASVIFISAYSDAATKSRALEAVPEAFFLGKPIAATGLARAIREIGARTN